MMEERIKKLRHLITCMKCEVSGKCCDDNCPTQYEAGNTGEIIENLEEIAKVLEQVSCSNAVSREAVLDALHVEGRPTKRFDYVIEVRRDIEALSPVTPQPKTGHWINGDDKCPCCEKSKFEDLDADIWADWQPKFCPNCGAKMEAEK